MKLPVKFTSKAVSELLKLKRIHRNVPHVRLGIKGGAGCGAIAFTIGLDKASEKDNVYSENNLSFVIEKGHVMHLLGQEVDFVDEEQNTGFVFNG